MDLRKRITEEVENLKYEKVLMYTYALIKSKNLSKDDITYDSITPIIAKAISNLFGRSFHDWDLQDKVIAAFMKSDTIDINSPSFVKHPKLKTFTFEGFQSYTEYGIKHYQGEVEGYTKESAKEYLLEDGGLNEYDPFDVDVRGYEVEETDFTFDETNNTLNEGAVPTDKSRTKFYLDYISNLIPDEFDICQEGDKITITIPERHKS